mmetsp:Transcript_63356/g.150152  ORF Transcript_63356/g.150152 Transcript_63356/m.150152 type:complete len:128 (-) Transcript_63356:81-464(-)
MDVVNVVFSTRPFVVAAAESLMTNNNTKVMLAITAGRAAAKSLGDGLGTFFTESDPVVLDAMKSSVRMRDPRPHGWWEYKDTDVLASVQAAAQALESAVEMPYELAGKPTSWEESENLLLRRLMTLT